MIDEATIRKLANALFEAARAVGAVVSHAGTIHRHHPAMLKLADAKLAYELADLHVATGTDMQPTHLLTIRGRAHAVRVKGSAVLCREELSCPAPGCESITFKVDIENPSVAFCVDCRAYYVLTDTRAQVNVA